MRVFVAGSSGVIGRCLVSKLVARGHQVNATTLDIAELGLLRRLGAVGLVMDGLDPLAVGEAVATAEPDVIVHQMTGPCDRHAGHRHQRIAGRFFATTNRLRTEGVDHLLAAAQAADVSRIVTLSCDHFNDPRDGEGVKTEDPHLASTEGAKAGRQSGAARRRSRRCRPAIRRLLRVGSQRWSSRAGAQAPAPSRWRRHGVHLVGPRRRRSNSDGPGGGAGLRRRSQHRRRRTGTGLPVASPSRRVRGSQASPADPDMARASAARRHRRRPDDRRAGLVQRQREAASWAGRCATHRGVKASRKN